MSGYTTFGRTQLKDSDFEGMTEKALQDRFSYLHPKVVELICKKYAKVEKPKKKTEKNA